MTNYVAKYLVSILIIIATVQFNIAKGQEETTDHINDFGETGGEKLAEDSVRNTYHIDDGFRETGGEQLLEDSLEPANDFVEENTTTDERNELVTKLGTMEAAFNDFVHAVSEKQANLQTKARDAYPNYSEIIKNSKDAVTNFIAAIERDATNSLMEMIRHCPKSRKLHSVCIAGRRKQMLNDLAKERDTMHGCLNDHLSALRDEEKKWQEVVSGTEDRFEEKVEKTAQTEDEILKNAKEILREFVERLDKLENPTAISAMKTFITEVESKRSETRDCLDDQKAFIEAQIKLKNMYKCIKANISRTCPIPTYKNWKNSYGNILSSEKSLD